MFCLSITIFHVQVKQLSLFQLSMLVQRNFVLNYSNNKSFLYLKKFLSLEKNPLIFFCQFFHVEGAGGCEEGPGGVRRGPRCVRRGCCGGPGGVERRPGCEKGAGW